MAGDLPEGHILYSRRGSVSGLDYALMLANGLNVLIQLLRYFRVSGALEHEVVRLVHQNEPSQLAEIPMGLKVGAVRSQVDRSEDSMPQL